MKTIAYLSTVFLNYKEAFYFTYFCFELVTNSFVSSDYCVYFRHII